MSGTFPTTPAPSEATLDSDQPVTESRSVSGKRQSRISAGHLWSINLTYPKMTRAEFAPIYAFSAKQRGDSFTLTLPHFNAPQGSVTGSININGTAEVGSLVMNIEGFTPGDTGVFKAGDILKADNHTKVYMAAADADAGAQLNLADEDDTLMVDEDDVQLVDESTGQAAVAITTPIIEEVTDGINITYSNVPFTVAFDKDIMQWKTTAPQLSAYSVELTESIT